MSRQPHPPKKKHTNRPRPAPVVPLTDTERGARAQEEYEKGLIHLIEAERMAAWGRAPNSCVHAAYYAMHHAARAALFATGGVGARKDVPKSHEHVLEHFGKLTQKEPADLGEAGRWLNQARTDRMVADYDLVRGAVAFEATETTRLARRFVDAVAARWGFYDNVSAELDDEP